MTLIGVSSGSLTLIGFVLGGVLLGTISGLTPGLHANNFALLLVSIAPILPGPPLAVGAAMLAAGVVHTFLDVVPALALGVPDADMAATALPGHRLVLAGRGRETFRLSAMGSGLAVLLALPLAVPVTYAMTMAYPTIQAHLTVVLGGVVVMLLASERTLRGALGGSLAFLASAAIGWRTLDLSLAAPLGDGNMLTPLFAGLFGAPVLLAAADGGVPPQADTTIKLPRIRVFASAVGGTVAGAIVGYLPGVSSAVAAVAVLAAMPTAGARGFIVVTSGVNTANTVFALFALVALGTPRTGVLVAIDQAGVPIDLPVLLGSVLIAAAVGTWLVPTVGDRYLAAAGRIDYHVLSRGLLVGLAGLSYLFAGPIGVVVFGGCAVVGLIPPHFGAKRAHCMGVLLGPLMLR
ncbi:MAG: tripartite tricarboxylate transporter permease [Halobacteriales archaeon]